ncbi:hypothetical protein GCM10022277_03680 [Litoribacillus peritrichatus]|uniref:Uncharacterized protein n=1 Tax=Litoribacillus peritrichatus TaxID=718191 RepID=A0ABP7M0F8_9GAMM
MVFVIDDSENEGLIKEYEYHSFQVDFERKIFFKLGILVPALYVDNKL